MLLKSLIYSWALLLGFNYVSAATTSLSKSTVKDLVVLKKEEKSILPLFDEKFKVIGIGLTKGQKLEKHKTPTPAFLYVEYGLVAYFMNDQKINLNKGDFIKIPENVEHEVTAIKDSRLLLIK